MPKRLCPFRQAPTVEEAWKKDRTLTLCYFLLPIRLAVAPGSSGIEAVADGLHHLILRRMLLPAEHSAYALLLKPCREGCCLIVIDLETLVDGLLIVVRTPLLHGTVQQASHQDILRDHELYHDAHVVSTLGEHRFQRLHLSYRAGKAIEDDALAAAALIVRSSQNVYHQRIGNQLSVVNVAFGNLAQLASGLDFATQHIARGDMSEAIFADEFCAIRALAGTGSTKDDDVFPK